MRKHKRGKPDEHEMLRIFAKDPAVRHAMVRKSFLWFIRFYVPHYIKSKAAPFHFEMIRLAEDEKCGDVVIAAFRGSAKSSIMVTAYVLWALLGVQGKRHVLLLSETVEKAQKMMSDIRKELEANEWLKTDLGPFREESPSWGLQSLVISRLDARISIGSVGQSIRGIKHRDRRPDLIVLDDIESLLSVQTRESREKAWDWLTGEVLPAGDTDTRLIAVGNLLNEESIMARLGRAIKEGRRKGQYREYPFMDERGNPAWPGKFPTDEAVADLKRRQNLDETAWEREFMLRIVPSAEQAVRPEWIRKYSTLPSGTPALIAIGIDLATRIEDCNDFTAMVPIAVYGYGERMAVYVLPHVVNEKMLVPESLVRAKALAKTLARREPALLVVESNGGQDVFAQMLGHEGYRVVGVSVTASKRSRVMTTTPLMHGNRLFFPEKGAERLIEQLVGLGRERHDDLADAFSIAVNHAIGRNHPGVRVFGKIDLL